MASTSEKDRKFFYGDLRLFLYYVKGVEGYKLPNKVFNTIDRTALFYLLQENVRKFLCP